MALTITDYLAHLRPGRQTPSAAHAAAEKATARAFTRLLAAAGDDEAASGSAGLTIADYLARPVAAPSVLLLRAAALTAGETRRDAVSLASERTRPAVDENLPAVVDDSDAPVRIERAVTAASRKYGLPRRLLRAVIRAESNFDPRAVSPAGAQGLMQLMPATAGDLGVSDPFDIGQNVDGGARYLRQMLDRFDGDLQKALAAYNAGPGTVERYRGRVPYPETVRYVARVMNFSGQTA